MIDIVAFFPKFNLSITHFSLNSRNSKFSRNKTFYKYENICKHVISYTCDFNVPIPKIDSFVWRDSENIVYKVVHELEPYL